MTSTISISEAPTAGLGKMLMESRFRVPTHQRVYSWDNERVAQFFDDLESALDRNDQFYFVGLMVFMVSDDGRLTVLDGQQRLATAVIIFAAIRAWFGSSVRNATTANRIQEDFIGRAELGETEVKPKLSLNYYNDDVFQKFVVEGMPLADVKKRLSITKKSDQNRYLLDAIRYCHEKINATAERHENAEAATKHFIRLATYLRDSVLAVRLTVPTEANAFRVFETLNDRGQELSEMDLVKNHLFGLAVTHSLARLNQLEMRWAQMMSMLSSSSSRADEFLKVFWTSRHGRTQSSDLFVEIKKRCLSHEDATDLSSDMLEVAEQYSALDSSDDPVWAPFSNEVRQSIRTLKSIGSKQSRPVVLSGLAKLSPAEFERLLRLLEVVLVRFQLIGGLRTGVLETNLARLAKLIFDRSVTTASEALRQSSGVYPSDEDFQVAFNKMQEQNNQKAQYLLRCLEREERRAAGMSGAEHALGDGLSIEHILPINPSAEWQDVIDADPTVVDDCAFKLGNICLLTEKMNRELGRGSFTQKKDALKNSSLITTRFAFQKDGWHRKAIEERQAHMARIAVSTWRFQ